jgi:hypothetical protein
MDSRIFGFTAPAPASVATVTWAVDFTYLYRQAALALPEGFRESAFQHLQGRLADLSLHLVAPTLKNLDVQSDERPLRIAVAYKVLFVPEDSAFDVSQDKQPCRHESVVDFLEKAGHIRPVDNVCGVLEYAVWHRVFLPDSISHVF